MAVCTAGAMHNNPTGAMVIVPMQPLLHTEPILMVHMAAAEALAAAEAEALAAAEALAEEDGSKPGRESESSPGVVPGLLRRKPYDKANRGHEYAFLKSKRIRNGISE